MKKKTNKLYLYAIMVLLVLFVSSGICELLSCYIFMVLKNNFYLTPDFPEDAYKNLFKAYDYELGWEPTYANKYGYRGSGKNIDDALLCLFGDSFTEGHADIRKTWPYLLEQKTGKPVLNFGVAGYGTDQAYLRFEKRYVKKIRTPYVCLSVMSENIARIVNRYRGFYSRKCQISLSKPMFYKQENGMLALLDNPVTSPDDINLLNDIAFLDEIGQKDYWYRYYEPYGLNMKAHFPYSYFFMRALPFYVKNYYKKRIKNDADYKHLFTDDDALSVLGHIIFSFINRAKEHNTFPIILFMPNWKDIIDYEQNGETVYNSFYHNVKDRYGATFDALDYFIPYLDGGEDVSSFFISYTHGHYNPLGERVIAEGFYRDMQTLAAENHN